MGKYEFLEVLRERRSTNVYLCKHVEKSIYYIIKSIKEDILTPREVILNEVNIGKELNHINFAKTYKNYIDKNNIHYLRIEYIENGVKLSDFIDKHEKNKITHDNFVKIVTQLFNSIIYCLNQNICPGDLDSRNILIDQNHKITIFDYGQYVISFNVY